MSRMVPAPVPGSSGPGRPGPNTSAVRFGDPCLSPSLDALGIGRASILPSIYSSRVIYDLEPKTSTPLRHIGGDVQRVKSNSANGLPGEKDGREGELNPGRALRERADRHSTRHASSKSRRGLRGWSLLASPCPRLHRKLDLTVVPAKN